MSNKVLLRGSALAVLALALLSTGCLAKVRQAAQRQQDSNDLKQLGLLYHNYHDTKNQWPASVEDLTAFAQSTDPGAMVVLNSVKSGKYVLYLGVDITKLPQGSGNTVLGYAATAPTAGGPVLMADGSVRAMTAAEFAAATKPPNAKLSQP